jgi:glycosyltransferase involved in cell wall biosynthesis
VARVLLLAYEFAPFKGGIASLVEGLATGIAGLGHDVHLLAPDYFQDHTARDAERSFTVHRFPGDFCSIQSVDKLTRFAQRCRRAIRELQPDAVHAADPQSQMALTALARFGAAHDYGFTIHGTELLRYHDEMLPRLWMQGAFRRPRAIVTVSNAVRQLLLEWFSADPARVTVAHPGIAAHWFDAPPADRHRIREGLSVDDDATLLVTVARRVREKGHLLVLDALAGLPAATRERVHWVIVGDGPDAFRAELEERAARAHVNIHVTGELVDDDARAIIDASDLFVMPSLRTPRRLEGFGMAYLEAGARGVPAIARATGGVAEAVRDGETGIVLPEDAGPEQLGSALAHLIDDPDRRRRLGNQARAFARDFTWTRHARHVCEALKV